jgi:[ribosomal protein S18]-alanine N-acetyltransferase
VTIRPATSADLAAIALIQAAAPEGSQWDPASYLDYVCTVAEEAADVAGFLVCRQTSPDEHEILNLAVHPNHRRRGLARMLLSQMLAAGRGSYFLEVRASNDSAICLYETVGFRQIGQRQSYYTDPPEPAIVMRWDS